jgi:hypothetical protein
MTTVEVPGSGYGPGYSVFEGGRSAVPRGRWTLIPGGTAETRPPRSPLAQLRALAPWRPRTVTMPLLSGALQIGEPVHATVGEIAVAVDKTRSVRLTLADLTALGNRRYAVDMIASALGSDAGPDEMVRLEGLVGRVRDGGLRVSLAGPAPASLIPAVQPAYGSVVPGALFHGSMIPGAGTSGSLTLSRTRRAGARLRLVATFGR